MPNWTNNYVIVSAKTEAELNEFLDFCEQPHTSQHINWKTNEREIDENAKGVFWNFVTPTDLEAYWGGETVKPTPEGQNVMEHIMEEMATGMDWYHWNVRNWGTKWDILLNREDIVIDQRNDGHYYFNWYFETAWSPAVEAYEAMSARFPNLDFDFEITEEANFFAGKLHYAGGVLVSDEFVNDPTHADFMALDIPCTSCVWGEVDEYTTEQILTLSKEELEEQSEYLNDDCPFRLLAEKRIAELEAAE